MTYLSVVLPVHNEEKNISYLYNELTEELQKFKSYEIIFVDDGSSDNSFSILKDIASKDKKIKVVKLLSNYGQSTALAAGIEQATGENIVTMDSDLQHDPKDIVGLLKPLEEGFHVVCGWRRVRGKSDSFMKKTIPSRLANFLVNKMTKLNLNDTTGGMRAFKRRVTEVIPLYGEMHRYLPILAKWKGFKITERPVHVRKRGGGKTHYNFKRIFRGFLDLVTVKFFISYSARPMQIFARIGILSFSIGFLIGLYHLMLKIFFGVHLLRDVASLILAVMLILLGVNFVCFGLLADMISFDAISNKKRKMYLVDEVVNRNK
jgi:glycosyltransferase involved in cell wall biosynthesis